MLEKHKAAAGAIETTAGGTAAVKQTLSVNLKKLEPYLERVNEEPMPEPLREVTDPNVAVVSGQLGTTPVKKEIDMQVDMEEDDEVDISSLLTHEFFEALEASKWQERKTALESLVKSVDRPRLQASSDPQAQA